VPKLWLHYIGRRVYTLKTFVREAERLGVARAFPSSVVKRMSWGEPILLAFWERGGEGGGYADVLGYFRVRGVQWRVSAEAQRRIIERTGARLVDKGGGRVSRRCGSYSVGPTYETEKDLSEVMRIAEEVCRELGEKLKFFLTGSLTLFGERFRLEAPFTRSAVRVEVSAEVTEAVEGKGRFRRVTDYRKRTYLPKAARESEELLPYIG